MEDSRWDDRLVRGRAGGPARLGSLVDGFLEARGIKDQVTRQSVIERWDELVGPHVASVTSARGISEATLFVEVRTSAWLMELNMMKRDVLRRVNDGLEEAPLERIVFVLAETE